MITFILLGHIFRGKSGSLSLIFPLLRASISAHSNSIMSQMQLPSVGHLTGCFVSHKMILKIIIVLWDTYFDLDSFW
ncbi:MAG: hypothetical protein Fur0016_07710 [Anaerolineales bacterium]